MEHFDSHPCDQDQFIDDSNDLQLAENACISDDDFTTEISPSYEEKRVLLKRTKILKQTWSILETFQKIKSNKLILSPVYQRNAIWPTDKQTSFIESIFMDILIPPIYVVEIPGNNMLEDSSYEVVDGKQRLTAIYNFINDSFKLRRKTLEYFPDLFGDKSYKDLEYEFQTEIKSLLSSVLDIYVITANSPEFTKYDIFSRLNKGSEKLKVNEIRKAIYRSETLTKIEDFVNSYIENPKSENYEQYTKLFSNTLIKRYEDYGRFYRSIAFFYQSDITGGVPENFTVKNYNSRPRDMINTVLNNIQKKEIIINEEKLNSILMNTLQIGIWLKDQRKYSGQLEYIIDAVIPFIELLDGNYEILPTIIEDSEFQNTFIKSAATTTNVNERLRIVGKYLSKS